MARPPSEDRLNFPLYRDWAKRLGGMEVLVQGDGLRWECWEDGELRVHYAPRCFGVPARASFLILAARRVVRLRAHSRIDVINGSDIWGALVGLMVRRRVGASVLFQLQGQFLPPSPVSYGPLERRVLYGLTKFVIQRADIVRCLSEGMRRQAIAHGASPARAVVLPTRCDFELFSRPPEADAPTIKSIAFVGNLIPGKGVQVLLRALAQLSAEHAGLECVIYGDGPFRPRLVRLADELGLAARVTFAGRVPHDDLPRLLGSAGMFVLPSFSEAMPRALIEAMALRLPVISTRVGAIPETIDDGVNGALVPPGDADALAAAIRAMVDDPAWARMLAARAEADVRARFSYQRHRDGMLRLCQQAVAMAGGRSPGAAEAGPRTS